MRVWSLSAACAACFIVCFLAVFFGTSDSVLAASFDASAETATIDVGNVLVNFTVNNPSAAIVQVNFTLPSGFSYYGGAPGTTSDGIFSPAPMPSWYNGTTTYIIATSGDKKFWFKVTTPSTGSFPSSFGFNISTLDDSGAFSSRNVSVTVNDLSAPKWSANSTSPTSLSAYVPNRSYIFNITWTDNVFLDTVIFEWDGTTNYTNTTTIPVQSLGSGKYSITFRDFAQGNYTYRWYADDQNAAYNSTSLLAFNVTKADNPINIYLNGNLRQTLNINDGETINVTVTGGNLILYKNESAVANPYIDVLPKGYYIFKANSSGNSNYTTNSTGMTSYLTVVYPAPKYSISTTIPTTWSLNSYALFNITWSDSNDANGFNTALIELNHSGTATNYTMSRLSGTNISTYGLNLSMPMVLTWRVFANNSYNTWNVTNLTASTIGKISPTISLNITPSLDVVRGTMTVVSCTSGQVSVNLYREGVLVSNPDLQTLAAGSYFYVCNNTATTNYSTASTAKILNVLRYSANISFVDAPTLISIKQNSKGSAAVTVKNIGNASYGVNFTVENITSSWYTLNATTATLGAGEKTAFLVNFSIGESVEVKDYAGRYKAGTVDRIVTSDFVLRVQPKEATQTNISIDLSLYRVNMTKVWADINSSKASGVNVTLSEQKIVEAKGKIDLAQIYINNGDYFSAYQLLDSIKALIGAAETQLKAELESAGVEPKTETSTPAPINWTMWAIVAAVVCGGGFLAYLLWPQPGYNQKTGRFTYKTPQERGLEALSETKEKIVSKVKPDVTYKPSFKQPSVTLSGVGVEQPIAKVAKTGRFTLPSTPLKEKVSQIFSQASSKIKDLFKKKQSQTKSV